MSKEEMYDKYKYLIPKAIKDLHCSIYREDDYQQYYDAGEMGLLQAIKGYNPNVPSSSSYFYTSIANHIIREFEIRASNKSKVNYLYNLNFDDDTLTARALSEIIPDERINIEQNEIDKETYKILYKSLECLKPTYKDIILKYFGINCKKETFEEMSKKYNVSKQALQVKKDNALKQLKKEYIKLGGIYE